MIEDALVDSPLACMVLHDIGHVKKRVEGLGHRPRVSVDLYTQVQVQVSRVEVTLLWINHQEDGTIQNENR